MNNADDEGRCIMSWQRGLSATSAALVLSVPLAVQTCSGVRNSGRGRHAFEMGFSFKVGRFGFSLLACLLKKKKKDEINVPIALSAFRDGDQGPSKVTACLLVVHGRTVLEAEAVIVRVPP